MTFQTKSNHNQTTDFLQTIIQRNPGEPEFHQAVQEFAEIVIPYINSHRQYHGLALLERMTEPDRTISFRVTWIDDNNEIRVNKGYRVQFNNAIGPYKGGIRFHPTVNLSILKFLGFEQIFKNSLTDLPMGGGKGGSDFDPKGKSDGEIMRFCQAFMLELFRHIGPDVDVPAGDIGVGTKEVGYMFGMYKKLQNEHTGTFTGKGIQFGGSLIRPEATGYGCVYFANELLKTRSESIEGKKCLVSGSGNVAQFTIEKFLELGGSVHSVSDSWGVVSDKEGITAQKLDFIKALKNDRKGRIKEFAEHFDLNYREAEKPWKIKCDAAFPCATQNEISAEDARDLIKNGCKLVAEGANMPTTHDGIMEFIDARILFAPGKASNAGGVATSGLEMTQNSMRMAWSREKVDEQLKDIMKNIHEECVIYGKSKDGFVNYVKGANIAGFVKVADAMIAQGVL